MSEPDFNPEDHPPEIPEAFATALVLKGWTFRWQFEPDAGNGSWRPMMWREETVDGCVHSLNIEIPPGVMADSYGPLWETHLTLAETSWSQHTEP